MGDPTRKHTQTLPERTEPKPFSFHCWTNTACSNGLHTAHTHSHFPKGILAYMHLTQVCGKWSKCLSIIRHPLSQLHPLPTSHLVWVPLTIQTYTSLWLSINGAYWKTLNLRKNCGAITVLPPLALPLTAPCAPTWYSRTISIYKRMDKEQSAQQPMLGIKSTPTLTLLSNCSLPTFHQQKSQQMQQAIKKKANRSPQSSKKIPRKKPANMYLNKPAKWARALSAAVSLVIPHPVQSTNTAVSGVNKV